MYVCIYVYVCIYKDHVDFAEKRPKYLKEFASVLLTIVH